MVTFSVWVTSPTIWTATNWPMGCCFTKCTLATRIVNNARIKTLVFYAGSVIWTVNVMLTFTSLNYKEIFMFLNACKFFNLSLIILTRNASAVGVSCKSRWTFTVGPVIVYFALSASSTRIVNTTRVDTSSVSASLAGCTFFIT